MKRGITVPSGILPLDQVLDGGLHTGAITHVYGEAASGKTTLGLQFVNSACRIGVRTVYVNSESSSPIERLEQITDKEFRQIEDMVRILIPKSFDEQGAIIDDLELYAREGTRLVVVDTLTRLYRAVLEDKATNYAAHRELNRQTGFLKGLARLGDMAVVVLNQVRGVLGDYSAFEPVAKNILDYWADYVVQMHIGQSRAQRVIERIRPEGDRRTAVLYLTRRGFSSTPEPAETGKWAEERAEQGNTPDV